MKFFNKKTSDNLTTGLNGTDYICFPYEFVEKIIASGFTVAKGANKIIDTDGKPYAVFHHKKWHLTKRGKDAIANYQCELEF